MKKILLLTLVLLAVSVSAYAMTVSQQWDKIYNFADDEALDIQQTFDGGYIVAGIANNTVTSKTLVLKLNSSGNILWEKTFGGINSQRASSIQQTIDGGYIIATLDGSILKVDSSGNLIWQNSYNFWQASIQQTTDGGYITAGTFVEPFTTNDIDIAITKLDGTGAVIWQKIYGGSGDEGEAYLQFTVPITQTTDGGYVFATYTDSFGTGNGDAWIVKLDSAGTIIWQKTYGGLNPDTALSIQESSAGGYIVAGTTYSFGAGENDAWILRLDNAGNIIWQKVYGGSSWDFAKSIQQDTDGGYVFAGLGASFSSTDGLWVVKLDSEGTIIWEKTYTERRAGNNAVIQQTTDGGYIVGTNSAGGPYWDFWVLKLNSDGEIADCNVMLSTNASVANTNVIGQNSDAVTTVNSVSASPINIDAQNTSASISTLCYYEDPNDLDGDGIENTPGGIVASSIFLAGEDNCPDMPNGPFLGTCIVGETYKIARPCINDVECGTDGFCSMNQEDSNEDGIGDACCLCECDFDCSGGVDASDVTAFLNDFGRSQHNDPCTNQDHCSGDVDCNGAVDANDVINFLQDFGRSQFNNPCPACEVGNWCVYP